MPAAAVAVAVMLATGVAAGADTSLLNMRQVRPMVVTSTAEGETLRALLHELAEVVRTLKPAPARDLRAVMSGRYPSLAPLCTCRSLADDDRLPTFPRLVEQRISLPPPHAA